VLIPATITDEATICRRVLDGLLVTVSIANHRRRWDVA
jgi:hypothetical protein